MIMKGWDLHSEGIRTRRVDGISFSPIPKAEDCYPVSKVLEQGNRSLSILFHSYLYQTGWRLPSVKRKSSSSSLSKAIFIQGILTETLNRISNL